jgi:hypothetical protein
VGFLRTRIANPPEFCQGEIGALAWLVVRELGKQFSPRPGENLEIDVEAVGNYLGWPNKIIRPNPAKGSGGKFSTGQVLNLENEILITVPFLGISIFPTVNETRSLPNRKNLCHTSLPLGAGSQ